MNKSQYTYLLANPQKVSATHVDALEKVLQTYPYFQSAYALQLKGLKQNNSYNYNTALKKTAAYTTDRNILFDYITSEAFFQNEISQEIKQYDASVLNLEVVSQDISEEISKEVHDKINKELKKAEAILNPDLFSRKDQVATKQDNLEDKLTNTPLNFSKSDTHSFGEWLQLSALKPISRKPETKQAKAEQPTSNITKAQHLIDRFISNKPKLKPQENDTKNVNLAAPFTQTPEALMTETLAKVYLQQKKYDKAIQAYKILILKNPEKSGFFADQIRAIQKLTNKE